MALLALLAAAGVAVVLLATPQGVGLSTDSVWYIEGARSMLSGLGYVGQFTGERDAITHWPPGYSAALAALGAIGAEPLVGARVLGALLFGANIFVAGWLVLRHGGNGVAAGATALFVLVAADVLEVHVWAWSEPLFILQCLGGLHFLALYLERPGNNRDNLLAAACMFGLAALTRYIGVAAILAGALAVLLLARTSPRRRAADGVLFGALAAVPLGLWVLRNWLVTERAAGTRALNWYGLEAARFIEGANNVSRWLLPAPVPGAARAAALGLLVLAVVAGAVWKRHPLRDALDAAGMRLIGALLIFGTAYTGFIVFTFAMVDADVYLDTRMLSPVHIAALVSAGLALSPLRLRGPTAAAVLAMVPAVALLHAVHAARWAYDARRGLGYAAAAWQDPELWRLVHSLPEHVRLYSNAYDAIYIRSGRSATPLPARLSTNTGERTPDYLDRLRALGDELAGADGFVLHVALSRRTYMPTAAELDRALAPSEVLNLRYGTLFRPLPREESVR